MPTTHTSAALAIGTPVEVFSTYERHWVGGFEIVAVRDDAYALRRLVDWAVLPGTFKGDDVRVLTR